MSTAAKVGAFFLIVLVLGAILIWQIEGLRIGGQGVRTYTVKLSNATGLEKGAKVRMAGVPVGTVKEITLSPDNQALVEIEIDDPNVELRKGASAVLESKGLIGDQYVELNPGPVRGQTLPEGSTISGEVPVGFDEITKLAKEIGEELRTISQNVSGALDRESLDDIVANVRYITEQVRLIVDANHAGIDETVTNMREFSASITAFAERIDKLLVRNEGNVDTSLANIKEITDKLTMTADNLNKITTKVESGEGTVGKLIESDETHKNLNEALVAVKEGVGTLNKAIGGATKLGVDIETRAEYYSRNGEDSGQGWLFVDLLPENKPRFYRLGLSSPPFGRRVETTITETTVNPNGTVETTTTQRVENKDQLTVTALVGYRWKSFTGAAGLIDSRGGGMLTYATLENRLKFAAELYDFSRDDYAAHAKVSARWYLSPSIYVVTGWDDFLNTDRKADSFTLGAGIRWSADEEKFLLSAAPLALP
jgi:phospholipid/cholesterol/gamma-HCH transport system substrate-binding protein